MVLNLTRTVRWWRAYVVTCRTEETVVSRNLSALCWYLKENGKSKLNPWRNVEQIEFPVCLLPFKFQWFGVWILAGLHFVCLYGWRSACKIVPLAQYLPECNRVSTVVILATSRPLDILHHPLFQLPFSLHHWTFQTDLLRPPFIKALLQLQWLRFVWFVVVFDFCCWESIVFFFNLADC
jgi:hypothetical protein